MGGIPGQNSRLEKFKSSPPVHLPFDYLEPVNLAFDAIHMMMQGKGGLGKSASCAFLAEYLLGKGQDVQCIDTDPVNHTLSRFNGLPVDIMEMLAKQSKVDQGKFDELLERLMGDVSKTFLVDVGASGFIPLWGYMVRTEAVRLLSEHGRPFNIHTIVAGGPSFLDTLGGLVNLAKASPIKNLVVWVNEREAPAEMDGKRMPEMAAYKNSEAKVLGTISELYWWRIGKQRLLMAWT